MQLSKPRRSSRPVVVPVHGHHMARLFVEYCRKAGYKGTLQNLPRGWVFFRVPVPEREQEAFIEGWMAHYNT